MLVAQCVIAKRSFEPTIAESKIPFPRWSWKLSLNIVEIVVGLFWIVQIVRDVVTSPTGLPPVVETTVEAVVEGKTAHDMSQAVVETIVGLLRTRRGCRNCLRHVHDGHGLCRGG